MVHKRAKVNLVVSPTGEYIVGGSSIALM